MEKLQTIAFVVLVVFVALSPILLFFGIIVVIEELFGVCTLISDCEGRGVKARDAIAKS